LPGEALAVLTAWGAKVPLEEVIEPGKTCDVFASIIRGKIA
jgi:hypothetical protein